MAGTGAVNRMMRVAGGDRAMSDLTTELGADGLAAYSEAQALLEQMAGRKHLAGFKPGLGPCKTEPWRAELRYRALVERLPAVTFVAALDMRDAVQELYISPQIEALLGFSQEQWLDNPFLWYQQLHPDDRDRWVNEFARTCGNGDPFCSEYRLLTCAGAVVWVRGECQIVQDDAGNPVFLQGIAFDITATKEAEAVLRRTAGELEAQVQQRTAELKSANRKLVDASRRAGMAEVATGVLHNVGNVLNSVNVSAGLVADGLKKSPVGHLARVAKMMQDHAEDLGTFLTTDPAGKQIPGFLAQLASHLAHEQAAALAEITHLQKNVDHIKEIVSTQQANAGAGAAGLIEPVDLRELLEDAMRIHQAAMARHDIDVVADFTPLPPVRADRHRVLQILVNLISNAKHAMDQSPTRTLTLRIDSADGRVRISIGDTGYGIAPENLSRIFAHGFTTRKGGHGFGLHSGALAATEMGGSLHAASDGLGRGAVFTLELPLAGVKAAAA